MEKEGGPVNRPPILDGSNYEYWKARMVAFLKSLDSRTWKAVIKGWEHPKMLDTEGKPTDGLKPEEDWTKEEDELALGNSKALNALFNGVDKNIFRLINTCTVAKDAWEILKITHEGTSKVKMSRLQLLATKFKYPSECIHISVRITFLFTLCIIRPTYRKSFPLLLEMGGTFSFDVSIAFTPMALNSFAVTGLFI